MAGTFIVALRFLPLGRVVAVEELPAAGEPVPAAIAPEIEL
jgi:hypothetical protein